MDCINSERHAIDLNSINSHTSFYCAKLLKLFTNFKFRRWQLNETFQRRAPISIKPDMMV